MGKISLQMTSEHLDPYGIEGHHSGVADPGGVRGPSPLPFGALEAIVAGLAQTAPGADHCWTEGTGRRYVRPAGHFPL